MQHMFQTFIYFWDLKYLTKKEKSIQFTGQFFFARIYCHNTQHKEFKTCLLWVILGSQGAIKNAANRVLRVVGLRRKESNIIQMFVTTKSTLPMCSSVSDSYSFHVTTQKRIMASRQEKNLIFLHWHKKIVKAHCNFLSSSSHLHFRIHHKCTYCSQCCTVSNEARKALTAQFIIQACQGIQKLETNDQQRERNECRCDQILKGGNN